MRGCLSTEHNLGRWHASGIVSVPEARILSVALRRVTAEVTRRYTVGFGYAQLLRLRVFGGGPLSCLGVKSAPA